MAHWLSLDEMQAWNLARLDAIDTYAGTNYPINPNGRKSIHLITDYVEEVNQDDQP